MTIPEPTVIDYSLSDVEEIEDFVTQQYGSTSLQLSRAPVHYRQHTIAAESVISTRAKVQIDVHADVDGYFEPLIGRMKRGFFDLSGHSATGGVPPGRTFLVPAEVELRWVMRDATLDIVTIPRGVLIPKALELFPEAGAIDTASYREMPDDFAEAWWGAHAQLIHILETPALRANELLYATALDHLVAATAIGFGLVSSLEDRGSRAGRLVRRAISHVEAHLDQPLTLPSIAAALHVSPRTLQAAFRKERDTTPMRYVRLARLDAARAELIMSDVGSATVSAVSRRWGFEHPGRFASFYAAEFGEVPSATLYGDASDRLVEHDGTRDVD